MNPITLFISIFMGIIILMAIFWVGIYVVLPIVLCGLAVSAICSLIKAFMPIKAESGQNIYCPKHEENQIIDVEFEEVK